MKHANVPGVGRVPGRTIEWLRGVAVYVVPLGLYVGLWLLAGLYYAAIDGQSNQPAPAVMPNPVPSMTYAEKDDATDASFG